MVATKELFQEALPMIDCFDYSVSIFSDPQKAEQIENNLSAIISSNPDLEPVSYTHLDVYKRQAVCQHNIDWNAVSHCNEWYEQFDSSRWKTKVFNGCLLYTSRCV